MSFVRFILLPFLTCRQLIRTFVLGTFLAVCPIYNSILSAAERTAWFSDVPLIDSVTVDAQLSFAFDSPSGRILVLHLQTQAADKDIQSSYHDALAALGWTKNDEQYSRGDELLKFEKIELEGKSSWRMTIIPISANQLEIR